MSSNAAENVTSTPKLKPCPFCGGAAALKMGNLYYDKYWRVKCTLCHIETPPIIIDHPSFSYGGGLDESTRYTEEQAANIAADMWNRRIGR